MRSRAVITLNPVEKDEVLQAIIRHRRLVEPSRKFCFGGRLKESLDKLMVT